MSGEPDRAVPDPIKSKPGSELHPAGKSERVGNWASGARYSYVRPSSLCQKRSRPR